MTESNLYTIKEQILDISAKRPHLVILGAGASVAACPSGDANANKLPVMSNLIEILELEDELDAANIPHEGINFEEVYSQIECNSKLTQLKHVVEKQVSEYFKGLRLPDEPTIYDYLVLSLRPKDAIATFNWDPFLWQTLERNYGHAPPPKFFFLHGCAIVGWCEKDKRQGKLGTQCPICKTLFTPTKLLYLIAEKNYTSDPYIKSQWRSVIEYLKSAFLFTIFGYAAPKNDDAAIDLMSKAWGAPKQRQFEEIEIIDIKSEDELNANWDRFIHSHHYSVSSDFVKSILSMHPRRSVEAYWQSLINARFREGNWIPIVKSLPKLWEWFDDLITVERKFASSPQQK